MRKQITFSESPKSTEYCYVLGFLGPHRSLPLLWLNDAVVGGALVTLIVRSHIEACGHFGGDGHNSHSPAEFGTLKLEKVKHELF